MVAAGRVMELSLSDRRFYAKLVPLCMMVGAGMEYFMIQTGFYDKVTEIEAEKMREQDAKREAFVEFITPKGQRDKE